MKRHLKGILSLLLALLFIPALTGVAARAAGSVVWSRDTVLYDGCDYINATVAAGVKVEIRTGILITGTLTVEKGGSLVGAGLLFPAQGAKLVGMTLYYRVAGEYKPFFEGLDKYWEVNLWPGYAPHFEYDAAAGLWYLYVESGDFEGDPFYPEEQTGGGETGGGGTSGGGHLYSMDNARDCALFLRELGLFRGVGDNADGSPNFDLERAPSRIEALVMLIRLMGRDAEALACTEACPFTDVGGWAEPYVAYAYSKGLTKGVSATEFGAGDATAQMYLTFVLRALGYSDTAGDFKWNDNLDFAARAGLLRGKVDTEEFWRSDVAIVSLAALGANMKDGGDTLAIRLAAEGVFSAQQYDSAKRDELLNRFS